MAHQFDELAKDLASGLSRREALRRFGGGLAGALLASMGVRQAWGQGNSLCAAFCDLIYPPGEQRGDCKSAAAHGLGICFECGPESTTGQVLCGTIPGNPFCCGPGQCCVSETCVNQPPCACGCTSAGQPCGPPPPPPGPKPIPGASCVCCPTACGGLACGKPPGGPSSAILLCQSDALCQKTFGPSAFCCGPPPPGSPGFGACVECCPCS